MHARRAVAACTFAIAAFGARMARAESCVAIAPPGEILDARGGAKLAEQLSASLAQHQIRACRAGEEALAEVTFAPADRGVTITVRDAVTHKEVARVVRVTSIPADGRPLAIALAADELLRASWAEILLARAPAPPSEPPPEVRALVMASLPPPPPPSPSPAATSPSSPPPDGERSSVRLPRTRGDLFLAAALAAERSTGGLSLGGVDVRFGGWLGERANLGVRLGARVAPSTSAADGAATATAFLAGVGGALAVVPRGGRVSLDVPVRVDAERLAFHARPSAGAHGEDGSAFGVTASTGLDLGLRIAIGWTVALEGTAGVVVRPIDANDASATFTALSGAVFGAALGLRAEL